MDADSISTLKEEVAAWATQMRTLFSACRLLIGYFGTDDELASWDGAVAVPLEWVEAVVAQMPPQNPIGPLPRFEPAGALECSESTARFISPLVEIVGGPVAEFVSTIRRLVPQQEQAAFTRAYGFFVVTFADAVTQPLWRTYRELAPDEWKAEFP
jgi:hypothetical protein